MDSLAVAIQEFIHVAVALVFIIAAISIITGVVREYIPQEKLQKKMGKTGKSGPILGALLGTLTPFCSASMVPVSMGMIEMKIPFSTVMAFLFSAPITNFVVVGVIFAVFGWKIALLYFLWTLICAMLAGTIFGKSRLKYDVKTMQVRSAGCCGSSVKIKASTRCGLNPVKESTACCSSEAVVQTSTACCGAVQCCEPTPYQLGVALAEAETEKCTNNCYSQGFWQRNRPRLQRSFIFAKALFLKILPFILLGAVISGFTAAFIPASIVEKYAGNNNIYAIPFAAAIGVPLYLRIEMAIPLLKVLMVKGMGIGAVMALLIGGTGASLPEMAILLSMLKARAVAFYVFTVFLIATVGGLLFHLLSVWKWL